MKPKGHIELAFGTGLIFCLEYCLGDGELQDSFRESLTLRLLVEVHSLLGQRDTKRAFHGRLIKIFNVVPYKKSIKT